MTPPDTAAPKAHRYQHSLHGTAVHVEFPPEAPFEVVEAALEAVCKATDVERDGAGTRSSTPPGGRAVASDPATRLTPYYDDGGITIYHGDCADVIPATDPSRVDLLLTDPPYGVGFVCDGRGKNAGPHQGSTVHGDDKSRSIRVTCSRIRGASFGGPTISLNYCRPEAGLFGRKLRTTAGQRGP